MISGRFSKTIPGADATEQNIRFRYPPHRVRLKKQPLILAQKCIVFGVVFTRAGPRRRTNRNCKTECGALQQSEEADPLQWLEELDTPAVRSWVESQNVETLSRLGDPRQSPLLSRLRQTETTDTDADPLRKLPQVTEIGGYFYDFWSDAFNPRGVWRRTTLDSFLTTNPSWEVVLDLDELCRREGESYVWRGFDVLLEAKDGDMSATRAMICLSRGGQDAFQAREFDLERKTFVRNEGFVLPESKSVVSYFSKDFLLVSTDFGPGSQTYAGYPRSVRLWKRGTSLEASPTLFEGEIQDHVVFGYASRQRNHQLQVVQRSVNFHTTDWYLNTDNKLEAGRLSLQKLDVPQDADLTIFENFLLLHLRSEFKNFPQGALLSQAANSALSGGEWQLLWTPRREERVGTSRSSTLQKIVCTRNYLVLQILDSTLTSDLLVLRHDEASSKWLQHWKSQASEDSLVSLSVRAVSAQSDGLWIGRAGFREPPTLFYAEDIGKWQGQDWQQLFSGLQVVRRLQDLYDASKVVEMRLEARSADGTEVPFTCLRMSTSDTSDGTDGAGANADVPTLVYAYGGFGIPLLPNYNATIGAAWLERGGQYVEVNLRGGGEFGADWERAGRFASGRLKAYEDLEAVADELLRRGLATPGRVALMGRSNGGLLVANQVVRELANPCRFSAFVAEVPLTDMRKYHRWLAGHSWLEEYGDPDDTQSWKELRQISAYHLAQDLHKTSCGSCGKPRCKMRVLFTTSTRDDRVHPCHARKMVKLLQSLPIDGLEAFLYECQEGGHGGAASIGDRAVLRTMEYEFLWKSLTT